MEAENIRKEFSALLSRLSLLAPGDRDNLLSYLRCALVHSDEHAVSSTELPVSEQLNNNSADDPQISLLQTTAACEAILNHDPQWETPFIFEDTLNLGYFVQTHEKSTNTTECEPHPVTSSSEHARDEPISTIYHSGDPNSQTTTGEPPGTNPDSTTPGTLRCPVCRREFNKWAKIEDHLYAAHTTNVPPVCWHCQGIFASHALLLAHECFDWGLANLPCQSVLLGCSESATDVDQHHQRLAVGDLDYPRDGVFIKRRCGLCSKSQTLFETFQSFRTHKKTAHCVDERLSPTSCGKRHLKPELQSMDNREHSAEARRRHSDSNFRSVVRYLFSHLPCMSSFDSHASSATQSSRSATMSLLAAQRERFKSDHSKPANQIVDLDEDSTSASSLISNRTPRLPRPGIPSKSYYPLTHWLWRRRKRLRVRRPQQSAQNPYIRHYRSRNQQSTCRLCNTTFRTTSHLKAHYLFKHGHVPENLRDSSTDERATQPPPQSTAAPDLTGDTTLGGVPVRSTKRLRTSLSSRKDQDPSVDEADTANRKRRSTGPPFACPHCPQSYTTKFGLTRHERQTHRGLYRFFCGYCEFRTNERCALDEHLTRHFGIKLFKCQFCAKRFPVRRELSDHVAFRHSTERNHKCTVCGLTFKTAGTLIRHRKIHESRVLHQCALCPTTFTRLSNLKRHTARAHPSPSAENASPVAPRRKRGRPRRKPVGETEIMQCVEPVGESTQLSGVVLGATESSSVEPSHPLSAQIASTSSQYETILLNCTVDMGQTATIPLVPVNTLFLPYVPTGEQTAGDESVTVATTTELPSSSADGDIPCGVYSSSSTETGVFSVPPSHQAWSGVNQDVVYLLPGSLVNSTDTTCTSVPPTASHHDDVDHMHEPRTSDIPTTPSEFPAVSSRLSHIWRPIECDLPQTESHVNFASLPSFISNSVDVPTTTTTPTGTNQDSSHPLDAEILGSPRFPSPVSCLDSPQPHMFHPPPTCSSSTSFVVDHGTHRSSFAFDEEGGLGSVSLQNPLSVPYSNPNGYLMMIGEARSQFLSPIWTCSAPMDQYHVYTANTADEVSETGEQCSNFSVGYLIGHRSSYNSNDGTYAIDDELSVSPSSSSAAAATTTTSTPYCGFDSSNVDR